MEKALQFENCGLATLQILPSTSTFLAGTNAMVQQQHKDGRLVSRAQQKASKIAAADAGDESRQMACGTQLSCNREVASGRGSLRSFGLMLCVCSHGIPALDSALFMPTPEQHAFYEAILSRLIPARPDVRSIYIDLMCRCHKRLRLMLDELAADGKLPAEEAAAIMLLVPWMHAASHDMACQLRFNGLFQVSGFSALSTYAAWVTRRRRQHGMHTDSHTPRSLAPGGALAR